MKSLHKIANVFLAISLLIATTGFTVNQHYCMGRLKAVAINESADPCSNKEAKEPMPCCEDVSQHLQVEEITKVSFDFDSQPDLVELAVISLNIANALSIEQELSNPSDHLYTSPPPDRDIQVAHQQFLI